MAIITVAGWKAYQGFSGTQYDATLAVVIPMAQAEMERFCSRRCEEATYTDEPHDGTGTGVFYTRNWPVVEIDSIKIDDQVIEASGYSCVTGAESLGRVLRQPQGRMVGIQTTDTLIPVRTGETPCWPIGRGRIKVSYTAGYDADAVPTGIPVPADLQRAAYAMVDSIMASRGQSLGVASYATGTQNLTFRSAMESRKMAEQLLGPYKRSPL